MTDAITFYFTGGDREEVVFFDFNDWQDFTNSIGIIDESKPEQIAFNTYCWNILSRHFKNVNIRYRDPVDFLCEFANVYQNRFLKFLKEKEIIDKIYNLTEDEYIEAGEALQNYANNPNTEPVDAKVPLDFISAQNFSFVKTNKVRAYIEALSSLPTLQVYDFINRHYGDSDMSFNDLFMNNTPLEHRLY